MSTTEAVPSGTYCLHTCHGHPKVNCKAINYKRFLSGKWAVQLGKRDDFQKRTEEQHLPEKPPSGSESKLLTAKSRTPAGVSWKPQLAPMSGHLFPAALPLYHPSELCAKHNAPFRTSLSEKGLLDFWFKLLEICVLPGGDDVLAQLVVSAPVPALLRGVQQHEHGGEERGSQSSGELSLNQAEKLPLD